jgi:hypothetical protein
MSFQRPQYTLNAFALQQLSGPILLADFPSFEPFVGKGTPAMVSLFHMPFFKVNTIKASVDDPGFFSCRPTFKINL